MVLGNTLGMGVRAIEMQGYAPHHPPYKTGLMSRLFDGDPQQNANASLNTAVHTAAVALGESDDAFRASHTNMTANGGIGLETAEAAQINNLAADQRQRNAAANLGTPGANFKPSAPNFDS